MTSKISLLKLIRLDMKQRSWLLVLMSVVCSVLLPVVLLMRLQNDVGWYRAGVSEFGLAKTGADLFELKKMGVESICGPENTVIWAGVIVAAMLAAFSGYAFLQSRAKIDFYHSLAIRRERLFFAPYVSGAILTVVPYVACQLIAVFVVGGFSGAIDGEIIRSCFSTTGVHVLSFFAVYSVLILGMVISGRMITGILFGVLFIVYGPMCYSLVRGLFSMSFFTYWDVGSRAGGMVFSPATMTAYLAENMKTGTFTAWMILLQAAFIVIGVGLSLFFYKIRPSEASENALIYSRMHGFLKAVVTVPAGICAGMICFAFAGSLFWLFGGALIGAFLINWLLDVVFDRDIKGIFAHKFSGGAILAATAAILLIFTCDLFGYDRWIPRKEKVEAMAVVRVSGNISVLGSYYLEEDAESREQIMNMMTDEIDAVYALAEEGVKRENVFSDRDFSVPYEEGAITETDRVVIAFRLSNGSIRFRNYMVERKKVSETLNILSENRDHRRKLYPAFLISPDDLTDCGVVDQTTFRNDAEYLALTAPEREELLECLQLDSEEHGIAELAESRPLGEIVTDMAYGEKNKVFCHSLTVYPQYSRTLRFLRKKMPEVFRETDMEDMAAGLRSVGFSQTIDRSRLYYLEEEKDIRVFLENFEMRGYEWTDEKERLSTVLFTHRDGEVFETQGVFADEGLLETMMTEENAEEY